jgi:hypothetical protein
MKIKLGNDLFVRIFKVNNEIINELSHRINILFRFQLQPRLGDKLYELIAEIDNKLCDQLNIKQ